jgi:NADPH:quinone reductase-like Zn-dependent oxidoreductase
MMQAVQYRRFGGPEVMELVELPDPEPGPGQVRVELRAASAVPGDWKLRAGHLREYFPVSFPKIPGRDGAGVVSKLGAGVEYIGLGARVGVVAPHTGPGTYAQAILRDRESIVPLPQNLAFDEAAALLHAGACGWICLVETAQVQPGMRVLVHAGAGAIGGLSVQLARYLGAHVAATCRAANLDYVRSLGAHEAIAYDHDDFDVCLSEVDIVLDLIGGEVHDRSYAILKRGGHMVCLIAAPFANRGAEFGVRVTTPRIHDRRDVLEIVVALAGRGILRPQICARMMLAEAAAAHRRLEAGTVTRGRVVLNIPIAAAAT